jgi:hypothetical protein
MLCAINFTFSMKADDSDYAAIGFKEMNAAYRGFDLMPNEIPSY